MLHLLDHKLFQYLDVRFESINIHILLLSFFSKIKNPKIRISHHYIINFIKNSNPDFVITYYDVDKFFWSLKKIFPKIIFIVIQQNWRYGWNHGNIFESKSKKKKKNLSDLFFVYGGFVKKLYKKEIKSNFHEIGSIENNKVKNKSSKNFKDIIFISSFKNHDKNSTTPDNKGNPINQFDSAYKIDTLILKFLKQYCLSKKKRLTILSRYSQNEEPDLLKKEHEYYKGIIPKFNFFKKISYEDTYKIINKFNYFVTVDSTLGYECLSRFKRVGILNVRYKVSNFLGGQNHRYGWPANFPRKGKFWTDDPNQKEMNKVLNFTVDGKKKLWLKLKKRYVDPIIVYDYKNRKLLKMLKRYNIPINTKLLK